MQQSRLGGRGIEVDDRRRDEGTPGQNQCQATCERAALQGCSGRQTATGHEANRGIDGLRERHARRGQAADGSGNRVISWSQSACDDYGERCDRGRDYRNGAIDSRHPSVA